MVLICFEVVEGIVCHSDPSLAKSCLSCLKRRRENEKMLFGETGGESLVHKEEHHFFHRSSKRTKYVYWDSKVDYCFTEFFSGKFQTVLKERSPERFKQEQQSQPFFKLSWKPRLNDF